MAVSASRHSAAGPPDDRPTRPESPRVQQSEAPISRILAELPYATVLRIAPVYESQARYRTLTDGVVREMMNDVMRLGFEPVLRDRAAQIAMLEEDFSNRELMMAERYREAIALLDSAGPRRRR